MASPKKAAVLYWNSPSYSAMAARAKLFLVRRFSLDLHVFELAGLENFTAFETLDEFRVFFTGNDLDTRVMAFFHWFAQRRVRRL
jgi:hypothetical protein